MPTKRRGVGARPPLRDILRHWRQLRRQSQLDLSLAAGVSQRHVSFIESGRTQPSRQMILDIAGALRMPFRETNLLLAAAGYAAAYAEPLWEGPELAPVRKALERVLRQHEPWPAVVMDRYWNVLMTNGSAPRFFGRFIDLRQRRGPRNILHLMFDPDGMRPHVANWEITVQALLQRVYRESLGGVIDERTQSLLEELARYPDVRREWKLPADDRDPVAHLPVLPISFVYQEQLLHYFSMISTVGTPQCVTAQEFRIECLYPADAATEQVAW